MTVTRIACLPASGVVAEKPNEALGKFLRERRESTRPEHVGLASRRGRRTPGLRREEVSFLADIGVKWYARLEAGHEVHPSEATLNAIAVALRLSITEFEYLLELAGLRHRLGARTGSQLAIPTSFRVLLRSLSGVAVTAFDRAHTPLGWNRLGDALFGHSRFTSPIEGNVLARALFDDEMIALLGEDRDDFIAQAVGMLRFNLASERPSPFAADVYERIKDDPLFRQAWESRIISGETAGEQVVARHHAREGRLIVYAVDLSTAPFPDLLIRALAPADEETAAKFKRMARSDTTCGMVPN